MKYLMLFILIWCGSTLWGQARPGIYIVMNMELDLCDHNMKLLNTETVYCLSDEPIIELDSFERVDEMVYDSLFQMRKFRILLTQKGSDYVTTIATKLPDHKLALVINGILVSIIDLEGIYSARSIIIWDLLDSQAMDWVHRSLVRSVTAKNKKS